MDIANTAGVSAASTAAQAPSAGTAQALILGVALQSAAQSGAALINAIPQMPALATSGSVGTRVNTFA